MKTSSPNGGGISVRTLGTLLKAFVRSRCEYLTACIHMSKQALTKTEKTLMKFTRTALSISTAGYAREIIREILDVESTEARHKLL